jgi:hypothetical protein
VDRKELRTLIPRGYGKVIAKRAGVTERSVSLYFTGVHDSTLIESTALKVLRELAEERKNLDLRTNALKMVAKELAEQRKNLNINTMTRTKLKKLIPNGYCKVIAERAGVTRKSVSDYLHGRSNSYKIEIATLEVVADLTKKKTELLKDII